MYVWTGEQWVDTSLPGEGVDFSQDDADKLYLSKKNDDTAAGLITFEQGVNVTGGTLQGPDRFQILTESNDVALNLRSDSGTSFTFNSANGNTGGNESRNISATFSGTGLTKGFTGITSVIGSDCSAGATGNVNLFNAFFNTHFSD